MLPLAIRCGVSVLDFWEMSINEVLLCIKNYSDNLKQEREDSKIEQYNLAVMISAFIGCVLTGKDIPTLEECYAEKQNNDNSVAIIKERMIDFANARKALKGNKNG